MSNGGPVTLDQVRDLLAEGAAGAGDFYAPLFLHVEPDGTVTADFEGHIQAQGLDLLAGTSLSPPDDRRVRWLRESDGALKAEIYAAEFPESWLELRSYGEAPDRGVVALRAALDAFLDPQAALLLSADDTFAPSVRAVAEGPGFDGGDVIVINGDRASDFLQLGAGAARWLLRQLSLEVNIPSTGAHTGGQVDVPVPSQHDVAAGDLAWIAGRPTTGRNFHAFCAPCPAANTIRVHFMNADTVVGDPAAAGWDFLVLQIR